MMNKYTDKVNLEPQNNIAIYYKNTFTPAYKKDEKVIKEIIMKNCEPTSNEKRIKPIIYYKSPRTASLIMKNNATAQSDKLSQTNVVYEYLCTLGDCATRHVTYIGHTTSTLSRRLTFHLQDGGIKQHQQNFHSTPLTRDIIVNGTSIIARSDEKRRLTILEAVTWQETNNQHPNKYDINYPAIWWASIR